MTREVGIKTLRFRIWVVGLCCLLEKKRKRKIKMGWRGKENYWEGRETKLLNMEIKERKGGDIPHQVLQVPFPNSKIFTFPKVSNPNHVFYFVATVVVDDDVVIGVVIRVPIKGIFEGFVTIFAHAYTLYGWKKLLPNNTTSSSSKEPNMIPIKPLSTQNSNLGHAGRRIEASAVNTGHVYARLQHGQWLNHLVQSCHGLDGWWRRRWIHVHSH